jgi:hypothetical protein
MGIVLGLIGAGGSALTMPIMVYIFHITPVLASTYSLFIVGLTSLFGSITHIKNDNVKWRLVIQFGIPSIIAIFLTRAYLLPLLPNVLFVIHKFQFTKDFLVLILFSVVMIAASFSMIQKSRNNEEIRNLNPKYNQIKMNFTGIFVGLITGLVGAGGGFLIIPVLIYTGKLPMKKATATSLMIITINSILGFLSDKQGIRRIDWLHMAIFASLAIIGIFIGIKLSNKISSQQLKPMFGWFILAMGVYIILQQIYR